VHSSAVRGIEPHRPFIDILERAGVQCLDIALDALGSENERHRALHEFDPDVVIHHWWGRDSLRPWLRDCLERPLHRRPHFVCVLHHAGIPAPSGYDRYVLVASAQRPALAHLPGASVQVVPNGVDRRRFRRSTLTRDRQGPVVVGRLSRLTPDKITGDWVRTAASFDIPNVRFVIAGSGPLLPVLRKEVEDLNLGSVFELPGYVSRSRVPSLLASFDVFCHVTSSAVESHPLALLESLAAGVPIVAEARGGIPEIVTHGVNGLLASSSGDVGTLLGRLCGDHNLRARLSAGARRTAGRFSLRRQVDGYRRLLAHIDGERSGGRRRHFRQPVLLSESRAAQLPPARVGQLPACEGLPDFDERRGIPQLGEGGVS
jgi:glycosyltransferase involved in cell wall biosynthesis